ncbi:hypothetical protein DFH28DRAFT_950885 [Melampsora americana]|nr:hypothetical protein DFH28DRAFT_950885 [Melampsora americana]
MKSLFLVLLFFPTFLALPTPSIKNLEFQTTQSNSKIRLVRRHFLQSILPNYQSQNTQFLKRSLPNLGRWTGNGMKTVLENLDASTKFTPAMMMSISRIKGGGVQFPANTVTTVEEFNKALRQKATGIPDPADVSDLLFF